MWCPLCTQIKLMEQYWAGDRLQKISFPNYKHGYLSKSVVFHKSQSVRASICATLIVHVDFVHLTVDLFDLVKTNIQFCNGSESLWCLTKRSTHLSKRVYRYTIYVILGTSYSSTYCFCCKLSPCLLRSASTLPIPRLKFLW